MDKEANETRRRQPTCCDYFSSPELSLEGCADGGIRVMFLCDKVKEGFKVYYDPKEGVSWQGIAAIMRIALPICARCTLWQHQTDSTDNEC